MGLTKNLMRTYTFLLVFFLGGTLAAGTVFGQAREAPVSDLAGATDSEVVGRLPGSLIIGQDRSQLDQVTYPMSELKKTDRKVGNNAYWMEPDETRVAEGERVRTVYLADEAMNPFGVVRAYEQDLLGRGAEVLWS